MELSLGPVLGISLFMMLVSSTHLIIVCAAVSSFSLFWLSWLVDSLVVSSFGFETAYSF